MDTRRPDVADIYAAAPDDPAEFDTYLAQACGDDAALRARVERLLDARAHRGSFLDSHALERTEHYDREAEHAIGSSIGPYQLVEEIGEGGMGVVYLAEQTRPVRRRVALKVIKPGMDTRQVIARFNAERQALALMDHVNICRVIDAGATDSGRPYFVMELVRGVAITEYCDRERLTIRQRLELFVQVCRAVQHAHQKGIIHRDIKPSNVLVTVIDGVAIPKIIDFGVAKATGASLAEGTYLTGFQQFIGTPLYMSPEQADFSGVDVDTRSDIYSLGVLLYELLTGTTPILEETFRAAGVESLRKLICEAEPPPPSSRLSTLANEAISTASANRRAEPRPLSLAMRGELDWIVMKALDKDRQRRYETAAALADDVLRHLNDEPVEACPPSRTYQLAKFARRQRASLATAATLLLAATTALGVSLWQTAKATRAAERAQTAEQAKGAALAQTRQAVDQMYTKVAEKWLNERGSLTQIQRELLEEALKFYEAFATDPATDPDIRYEALRARMRVAHIRRRLGNLAQAEQDYGKALVEAHRLLTQDPQDLRSRVELVSARTRLVAILREKGSTGELDRHLSECLDDIAAINWQALGDLSQRERLANVLGQLSSELTKSGQIDEAQTLIDDSLAVWKSLINAEPENLDYQYGLASAHYALGLRQMWWGSSHAKAEASYREAERILTGILQQDAEYVKVKGLLAQTLGNLGRVLDWTDREEESIECERRALILSEDLANEFPDDVGLQRSYLLALQNLGLSTKETKASAAGDELLIRAHELLAELVQRFPEERDFRMSYVRSWMEHAHRAYGNGDRAEAERSFEQGYHELLTFVDSGSANPEEQTQLATFQVALAAMAIERGDHARAAKVLDEYPASLRSFQPEMSPALHPDSAHGSLELEFYQDQAFNLMTTALLLDKCSHLATHDAGLEETERPRLAEEYRASASAYRDEANLASAAWTAYLLGSFDKAAGFRVAFHVDSRIEDIEQTRSDRIPREIRQAKVEVNRTLVRRAVEETQRQLAHKPSQMWASLVLSGAPPSLRAPQQALTMAERAVAIAPNDKVAREILACAQFRVGDWQQCIDNYTMSDPESGPHSILTMALWKVGRHDEARALLAEAPRRLELAKQEHIENTAKGVVTLPSYPMLERLHREAVEMVEPEKEPREEP